MKLPALLLLLLLPLLPTDAARAAGKRPYFPAATLNIASADGKKSNFKIEIATTEVQKEYGLMFLRHLPPGSGMLFVFNPPQQVAMWMKNTEIPLDMVFIGTDNRISYIAAHAVPESEDVITCPENVKGVLELGGGVAARLHIMPGDTVSAPALAP